MIYANLVSCRVFVSLRPGTHIIADEELWVIVGVEGHVESAGPGFLRLEASGVYVTGTEADVPVLMEGEESLSLSLSDHSILLVQLLEEGDTIEEEEDDDDDAD
jgi:hypothetical protein